MNEDAVAKTLMGLRPTTPVIGFVDGNLVIGVEDVMCPFRGQGDHCLLVTLEGKPVFNMLDCRPANEKPPECPLRESPITVRLK
jgi:hypothetical protein